jgi:sodium transport system ATP-binding protein
LDGQRSDLLCARGLTKSFADPGRGRVQAVDRFHLDVRPGEVVGLLGKNGAGKTTTLRMLATLLPPDDGSVRVGAVDARERPVEARRSLAYVPAESGLPPRLSPMEVVSLFASLHGLSQPERAAKATLARLGVEKYAHTPCGDLSTGMKRRVVLARALVHGPRLLLLDEPTDGLDVPGRRDVLALVRALVADGCGVLLSSHIMSEVEAVADRYVILAEGRTVGEGTASDLLARTGQDSLDAAFLALVGDG